MGSHIFDFHAHALTEHRKRVNAAKAIVDNRPPILHAGNFSRFSKLKEDVYTFIQRNQDNANLLVALNRVARTRGVTDSFRTPTTMSILNSRVPVRIKELQQIEKDNMRLGKILLCMRKEVDTWTKIPLRQDKEREKNKTVVIFTVPTEILAKYTNLEIPRNPDVLKTLLRPKIWFQLEVKGVRPLGLVAIQLYTEAAPLIVLEFVRLCNDQQPERIKHVRLFPSLWVEGEMKLSTDTLLKRNIEFDKRVVDHGAWGILSFSLSHMKICQEGYLYYTISFKPLRVLNGHRVGFGRVVSGFKILNCIQDYGTKNGKPTKEVVVSSCGVFK